MSKSLLDRIKAKPPAGPRIPKWWVKLERENPKAHKAICEVADAYWKGELSARCPGMMALIRELEDEGPKLGINKSETGWKDFINSRKPQANG